MPIGEVIGCRENTWKRGNGQGRVCYTVYSMLPIADPYLALYGVMLVLFGGGAVMAIALKRIALLAWPLAAVFGTLGFLFVGLAILDLTRVYAVDLRPTSVDYRWVLYLGAMILLDAGTLMLWVYGEHAAKDHAWEYRVASNIALLLAFAVLVGIMVRPLFV